MFSATQEREDHQIRTALDQKAAEAAAKSKPTKAKNVKEGEMSLMDLKDRKRGEPEEDPDRYLNTGINNLLFAQLLNRAF